MKLGDNILRKAEAITWPSVGVLHPSAIAAGRVNRRARYVDTKKEPQIPFGTWGS